MKILFVAGEAVPFVKTGGLADVVGSLPLYLKKEGVDIRVVIPKYSDIPNGLKEQIRWVKSIEIDMGCKKVFCGIEELKLSEITFYFLDNLSYFNRSGLYGHYDDGERFSFFCKGAIEFLQHIGFKPDIVHCHDWHSGMVPVLISQKRGNPFYKDIKSVFTIHNLMFQGKFPKEILYLLGLDDSYYDYKKLEYYDEISFMKGGIIYSNILTTVSPSYAMEIKTPYYGEGLDGLINHHHHKLRGVLNGIDYGSYNPGTDNLIQNNYSIDEIEKKAANKLFLQESLNLPSREDIPLIGVVSRVTNQKGFDLIEKVLTEILALDLQMVVLGTGDKKYEDLFSKYAAENFYKFRMISKFNTRLSHEIYAGSDMLLMPSLFEPCGLSQLIALRYGSIPIVRETGGLKDTVIPYNNFTGEGNGFSFKNYNAHDMLFTIQRAVEIFYNQKHIWYHLMKNAMETNFSWDNSAKIYMEMYRGLIR